MAENERSVGFSPETTLCQKKIGKVSKLALEIAQVHSFRKTVFLPPKFVIVYKTSYTFTNAKILQFFWKKIQKRLFFSEKHLWQICRMKSVNVVASFIVFILPFL